MHGGGCAPDPRVPPRRRCLQPACAAEARPASRAGSRTRAAKPAAAPRGPGACRARPALAQRQGSRACAEPCARTAPLPTACWESGLNSFFFFFCKSQRQRQPANRPGRRLPAVGASITRRRGWGGQRGRLLPQPEGWYKRWLPCHYAGACSALRWRALKPSAAFQWVEKSWVAPRTPASISSQHRQLRLPHLTTGCLGLGHAGAWQCHVPERGQGSPHWACVCGGTPGSGWRGDT